MVFEKEIIVFLQQFSMPWLDKVMSIVAYFFDWPVVVAFALILIVFKRFRLAIAYLISAGASTGIQVLIKSLVNRPRPYVTYEEIKNIYPASNSSFPSGHSTTCMCVAVVLIYLIASSNLNRKQKNWSYVGVSCWCLLCLFNRMYLGQHYFTDCLAGFCLGAIVSFVVMMIFFKQKKVGEKSVKKA